VSEQLRYGVFRIDAQWCVLGDDFARLLFPTLGAALAATDVIVNAHLACGEACEITVQDEAGQLIRLPEGEPVTLGPVAEAIVASGGRAASWLA
jgi:hypothetical protein